MAKNTGSISFVGVFLSLLLFATLVHSEEILYRGATICDDVEVSIVFIYIPSKSSIKSFNVTFNDLKGKADPYEAEINDVSVDSHGHFSGKFPPIENVKAIENKLKIKISRTELVKGVIISPIHAKSIIGVERKLLTGSQRHVLELASGKQYKENSIAWGEVSKFPCEWYAEKSK